MCLRIRIAPRGKLHETPKVAKALGRLAPPVAREHGREHVGPGGRRLGEQRGDGDARGARAEDARGIAVHARIHIERSEEGRVGQIVLGRRDAQEDVDELLLVRARCALEIENLIVSIEKLGL